MRIDVDLDEDGLGEVAYRLQKAKADLEDGNVEDPHALVREVRGQIDVLSEWVEHAGRQLASVGFN